MTDLSTYCKRLNIPIRMLKSRSKKAKIVTARQVYWHHMYYTRKCTLGWIGLVFARTHSTVYHGIKRINNLISLNDKYIKRFLEAINNK